MPIHKEGNREVITNYRPISILSAISKVFERALFNRLYKFIDKFKLFSPNQFGFRPKRNTSHALLEIIEKIRCSENLNESACCILLDLRKAFDTLNHTILLRKLEKYGIRGIALSILHSYLSDRQQYVCIGPSSSSYLSISCGVPQGSILCPLLFLIYVNDIANACNNSTPYLFADDTNMIGFGRKGTVNFMQSDLSRVSDWMSHNKLSLNVEKSSAISFNTADDHSLTCGETPLPTPIVANI